MILQEKPTVTSEEMQKALRLAEDYMRQIPGIASLVPNSGTAIARRGSFLLFLCRLAQLGTESEEWWVVDLSSDEVFEVPSHQHPVEFFEELVP